MAVFGAGGHASVAMDVLTAAGYTVAACLTPGGSGEKRGVPILDEVEGIRILRAQGVRRAHVALGDNVLRERVTAMVQGEGFDLVSAISPTASVADDVEVGAGTLVVHGAVVNVGTRLGAGVIVNTLASVDHDGDIGDFAHIAPGTHLAGNVTVGARSLLGVGTSVIPETTIGHDVVVGAGSVVVTHLDSTVRAWGNPARTRKAAS
ncbi:NeuD/PglB/VioB family sugar acetyltransferase [Frondihabitans australicus]|uniref:NeuD/PglB/VioB family sugar acetyltransferase n=1 Tax=Frondihabitans australicus TaxID=386892 RepID=UPI0011C4381D|nr:NeuD/PglB/VioB family sugar acetyltransferase [Frondihabitans australicus]